jgi:hypothetical protein
MLPNLSAQEFVAKWRRVDLSEHTMTNLYNQRPTWLANAHRRLDEAVFAAYGWLADLSDDEVLGRLLALNLERAGGRGRGRQRRKKSRKKTMRSSTD